MLCSSFRLVVRNSKKILYSKVKEQARKTKVKPAFTLQEFLEGRSNFEAYSQFCSYFLPSVGKKTYWRDTVLNAKTDQDVITKSNEAFTLLCLENQWDRWFDL